MDFYGFYMYIFVIMINDTSMLKIVFSTKGHATLDKNWTGACKHENYARLYYILTGEAEIWHHGKKFLLTPGRLYLIPPQSNMRHRCRDSFEIVWVHFSISLYGYLDLFEAQNFSFVHLPENPEEVEKNMLELQNLLDQSDIFSQLRSKALLLKLVSKFFKYQPSKNQFQDQEKISRLSPVLNYIDQHLGDSIKLSELAKLAAYEQTYFSTLFKQVFGISPIKYIQNKRIEKAQSMLRCGNLKLSAIAEDIGFIDAFHFSKTFKKITGENPSEFRKKHPSLIP